MQDLEKLIVDLKDSSMRELAAIRHDLRQLLAQLNGRFDTQAARLERHADFWQTSTRWGSRMDAWAEKVDGKLEGQDREIAELRERIERLERGSA